MESSESIRSQAARWLVRQAREDWSEEDRAALRQWLGSSTAHVVAYLRLEAAWNRAARLKSLGAGLPPGTVPSPDQWRWSTVFETRASKQSAQAPVVKTAGRRRLWMAAAVAGIAGALALGVAWHFDNAASSYRTPVGGVASIPLDDGSRITLNTDSAIQVAMTQTERSVQLERGEAYFEVAPDPSRPFVVMSGSKRVIAIGTAFSVRRQATRIQVVVTEGSVKVDDAGGASSGGVTAPLLLTAGSVARSQDEGMLVKREPIPEVERSLSWRSGFLSFEDAALSQVVEEFNRYSPRSIVVADPRLEAIRLTGTFESGKHEAFIRLLEDGFGIRAEREKGRIVLSKR